MAITKENVKQILVNKVIKEIQKDVQNDDLTALNELLKILPSQILKAYLPE